eukprot:scaffold5281_cov127-Cylindrotheca_fusiformis.AAC.9
MRKDSHRDSDANSEREEHPFRVIGIAMVVDQRGIGARMVARYPTQPTPRAPKARSGTDRHYNDESDYSKEDLFFSLTAFQMAKLFRTKRSLCGRPMTLTVNGTVFCCRAVLMEAEEAADDTSATETKNQLVLFSVIVALSSPVSHTSVPFSWMSGMTDTQLDLQRFLKEATSVSSSKNRTRSSKKAAGGSVSSAFLSVRRVHISLARYCRVLEREEKRCQYVSKQADLFCQIRNERHKKWEQQKIAAVVSQQGTNNPSSASSSVMSGTTAQTGVERRGRHRSQQSMGDEISFHAKIKSSIKEEQDLEQDILELMLSAFQEEIITRTPGKTKHHGNMVRELVQVYHSLSRNDYKFPPTPTALLSERDCVVYVNSHIAVPIEAVSPRFFLGSAGGCFLRPYYTLLFPHASPSELIEAFQTSGSAAPQRLQQLLLTVNPQKPLSEIAVDANLPPYTTMEIASYLITHGACVSSPTVSRNSKLLCSPMTNIPQLALEFSQFFGNVNFFRLVGFLTSSRTLGECMSILNDMENDEAEWLRESLAPSGSMHRKMSRNAMSYSSEDPSIGPTKVGQSQQQQKEQRRQRLVEEMDESLYAMTIWLLSHRVLTQTQEYLVAAENMSQEEPAVPQKPSTYDADEKLFRELMEYDFLNGSASIVALSWQLGLDQQKIRSWAQRHKRVRVISRIPAPGDDWEFEVP